MRIVFMGTPDFAVPSLNALYESGNEIAAVFTRADRPVGKHRILTASPVKSKAVDLKIPVYQPNTLKSADTAEIIRSLSPDLIVVAAYGRILPSEILKIPRLGCVNLHASLLPKYRGASPIQSAVMAGDAETGVTVMRMNEGLDTGDILLQRKIPILAEDTAVTLSKAMSAAGADLLVKAAPLLESGCLTPVKQDDGFASYCETLKSDTGKITPLVTARDAVNMVRGLLPWPCAYFSAGGKRYKIFSAKVSGNERGTAGTLCQSGDGLLLLLSDGAISIGELQPEGGRRMASRDFLNGFSRMLPLKIGV